MGNDIEKIRKAAYRILHLIFVKYIGPDMYMIVGPGKGGVPKLTDYISFHYHESRIRMKDIGSNIIYLLSPVQFKNSLLEDMVRRGEFCRHAGAVARPSAAQIALRDPQA